MAWGKRIRLTGQRRLVCDIVEQARRMPIVPIERTIDISAVARLRRQVHPRISWGVIMLRAYGLVCAANPVLRRIYVPWPWPHFYESPESICMMTVNRELDGEEQLMFARFCRPELYSLIQLEQMFEDYRRRPIRNFKQLRHQARFASMPRWIRRLGWMLMNNWMPRARIKMTGTFGMSLSGLGDTLGTWHLGTCSTVLGYDQICRHGKARLTLTFDHRVLDGMPAFHVLENLKETLEGQICRELEALLLRPSAQAEEALIRRQAA